MIQWLGNPLSLQQGQRYRGRIDLTGMQATFATASAVVKKFTEIGFTNVSAYPRAGSDWPQEAAANPGRGTWFVQGTWAGGTQSVERPRELTKAWVHPSDR